MSYPVGSPSYLPTNHFPPQMNFNSNFSVACLSFLFVDVSLACKAEPQRPDNEVFCLEPVKWMFEYLDRNNDNILEHTELADIEEADSEKCMKKFFLDCDRNRNGTVEKTEFCRCLCVGM